MIRLEQPYRAGIVRGAFGRLCLFLLALSLLSCASAEKRKLPDSARIVPGVPFYPQKSYQCGPASLAGALNYYRADVSPDEIAAEVFSSSARGALPIDLVLFAEEKGFSAREYRGSLEDLKQNLDSGIPLILFVDYGFRAYSKGHFMVAVGYTADSVVVNSGAEELKTIRFAEFEPLWSRTGNLTIKIEPR